MQSLRRIALIWFQTGVPKERLKRDPIDFCNELLISLQDKLFFNDLYYSEMESF